MKQSPNPDEKDQHDIQMRESATERLTRTGNMLSNLSDKTPYEIIHELRVY